MKWNGHHVVTAAIIIIGCLVIILLIQNIDLHNRLERIEGTIYFNKILFP